jgi:uncharacterized membrane protein
MQAGKCRCQMVIDVGYVFALLAALAYGGGDFLGGFGARKCAWPVVAMIAQAAGLVPLSLLAVTFGGDMAVRDFGWCLVAGFGAGVAVCLLYKSLADGKMSVIAPITALCAIVLPSLVAAMTGPLPSGLACAGIVAAGPALLLISHDPTGPALSGISGSSIGIAMLAGVGIAVEYIAFKHCSPAAQLWPALVSRMIAAGLCLTYTIANRRAVAFSTPASALVIMLAAGVLDGSANALLLVALHHGELATVATLTSLYPAVTIILAGLLLHERTNRWQKLGLVLAGAATVVITQAN